MTMIGKVFRYTFVIISLLLLLCIIRTTVLLNYREKALPKCHKNEDAGYIELNDVRWQRLRDAIRFKTISYSDHVYERDELARFQNYIIRAYPDIFSSKFVEHEVVNNYSLLIHVNGRDEKLMPYLIAAHMDVVPVVQEEWSVDAFGAVEQDGFVYGRGAIDDKGSLMAELNALEFLLQRGIRPERSFYLAFGHDEEVTGLDGAEEIARTLRRKGVDKLHFVLDEGMLILHRVIPGLTKDFAGIGVTEKGFLTLNLSVTAQGGHSSIPPKESAIGILAKAVSRLESNPMPGRIESVMQETIETIGLELSFPFNVLATNQWLFKSLWTWALCQDKALQGTVRTTTAVTIIHGGMKTNVIPASAWAIVNHRVHPQDTMQEVIGYDKKIIDDERVKITTIRATDPHPISPFDRTTSVPYQLISDTVDQVYDNTIVGPSILPANTDTKSYLSFTNHIYRFFPIASTDSEISRIHGKDERISRDNFEKVMNFYYHLMRNADRVKLRTLADHKGEL